MAKKLLTSLPRTILFRKLHKRQRNAAKKCIEIIFKTLLLIIIFCIASYVYLIYNDYS